MRPQEPEKRPDRRTRPREYVPSIVMKSAMHRLSRWQAEDETAWDGAEPRVILALFFELSRRFHKSEVETEFRAAKGAWERFCMKHEVDGLDSFNLVMMVCKRDEDNVRCQGWTRAQPFMLCSKRDLDRVRGPE